MESVELGKIITESADAKFCDEKEILFFKDLINNSKIKRRYQMCWNFDRDSSL